MNSVYLLLKDLRTNKVFKKYFITEFEKEKFVRKLKYSKNIIIMYNPVNDYE